MEEQSVVSKRESIDNEEQSVERTLSFERLQIEKKAAEDQRMAEQARRMEMERLLEESQNRLKEEEREKIRLLAKVKEEEKAVHDALLAEVALLRQEVENAEAARRAVEVHDLREQKNAELVQDENAALSVIVEEIANETASTEETEVEYLENAVEALPIISQSGVEVTQAENVAEILTINSQSGVEVTRAENAVLTVITDEITNETVATGNGGVENFEKEVELRAISQTGAKEELETSTKEIPPTSKIEEQAAASSYIVPMLSESNSDLDRTPRYTTIFEGESNVSNDEFMDTSKVSQYVTHISQQNQLSAIDESQDWDSRVKDDPEFNVIAGVIANLQNETSSSHSSEINSIKTQPFNLPEAALVSMKKSEDVEVGSPEKEKDFSNVKKSNRDFMDESKDWDLQTQVFSQSSRKGRNTKRCVIKVEKYSSPERASTSLSLNGESRDSMESEDWDLQTQVFSKTRKVQDALEHAKAGMKTRQTSPRNNAKAGIKARQTSPRNITPSNRTIAHPAAASKKGSLLQAAKQRIPTPSSKVTQDSMQKNIKSTDESDVFDFGSDGSSCSTSEYPDDSSFASEFSSGSESESSAVDTLDLHVDRSDASSDMDEPKKASIWKLW